MSQSDFVSRGQALVAAGQYQEAVKVCRLGLLGRPTTVEGRVVLGQALLALKRYDEVLAEMGVALELDHASLAAQLLRAEALLRKGDTAPAIEALHKARQLAPGDARILQLLGEAEHGGGRESLTHPAVDFIGSGDTKHYPKHTSGPPAAESGTAGFTRPTAVKSAANAVRPSTRGSGAPGARTAPRDKLAVGDSSGTVELDPEAEGIEVPGDLDFDEVAPPPSTDAGRGARGARGAAPPGLDSVDGTIAGKRSLHPAGRQPPPSRSTAEALDDDEELLDDDLVDQDTGVANLDQPGRRRVGASAVRDAVGRPSGVIGDFSSPAGIDAGLGPPPGRAPGAAARSAIAAALPTVAAAAPPSSFAVPQPAYAAAAASVAAAQRPTMAVAAAPSAPSLAHSPTAMASPPAYGSPLAHDGQPSAPGWAAPGDMAARPVDADPHLVALMAGSPSPAPAMMPSIPPAYHAGFAPPMPLAAPAKRSPLRLALWGLLGAAVIGGGVFAGFQIRAMRLDKQIAVARQHATDVAKADTWTTWLAARTSLREIARASATPANRIALARSRALVAFEFGDGLAEASAALDQLAGQGGHELDVAATFEALSRQDVKAARTRAEAAVAGAEADPAAHYVAGHAALLAGNVKGALAAMKLAADQEARPRHGIGLARAHAAAYHWDEAIAAIDRVLAGQPEHPGALIARATVLAACGRIFHGSALGNEVKQQLERVIDDGSRPPGEQRLGVSPTQVAHALLALARVEFARGDLSAARRAVRSAAELGLEDAGYAEDTVDTLYQLGELTLARAAGELVVEHYPQSVAGKLAYARVLVAQGKGAEALALLERSQVPSTADVLAVRGAASLAEGDTVSAATDLDAALKAVPTHEPALVARTWLELSIGDLEAATRRIGERMSPRGASSAVAIAYAATLRASTDPALREQAKALLEKVVAGAAGPEAARAHLELARAYREAGDFAAARAAFEHASVNGNGEARMEHALLLVDYGKPAQARELLEALLVDAGDHPSALLVIEAARVRLLTGRHEEAAALLTRADKMASVERWKLDRERGRLALRTSDFSGAAAALGRALDGSGADIDTLLMAADAAINVEGPLADKVRQVARERLAGIPEGDIVVGKLLLGESKKDEAEQAYANARRLLREQKASNRRVAQADFGLAYLAYLAENWVKALNTFDLVTHEDPTLVDAYTMAAAIAKRNDRRRAFGYLQEAVRFNPDYAAAWSELGRLAHALGDKATLSAAIARLVTLSPDGDELAELKKLAGR